MNYQEAREYLAEISARGSRPGLDSVRNLMNELGNPQDQMKYVHVAGTNGKGSVMAFLEETLIRAGYRTGRFFSPVLFCYEEMIQVNHRMILKEEVAEYTGKIREAAERIAARGEVLPTVFEMETAMAFLHFAAQHCDIVLLETGMGGRLDATNIIRTPVLEIITSISMDHMQFLGSTLEEIAWNKAGIIKPGTVVVSDAQQQEAAGVLGDVCRKCGAKIMYVRPECICNIRRTLDKQMFDYAQHADIVIHLAGTWQIRNASLALEAVDALRVLGWKVPEEAVREGFSQTSWEGRFTLVHRDPAVIMDGAHNPDAAAALMASLDTYFPDRRIYYIFGVFSDKEYDKIIQITARRAEWIYTVQTRDNPRALPAEELMHAVSAVNPHVSAVGDVRRALDLALLRADREDVIVAFGSLSFLKEIKSRFSSQ